MTDRYPRVLIYDTEAEAEQAQHNLAVEMGILRPGNFTSRWSDVEELTDGRYAIVSPRPEQGVDRHSVKTRREREMELAGRIPYRNPPEPRR